MCRRESQDKSPVDILPVIRNMCDALKDNGVIYTYFKYGEFEGIWQKWLMEL